MAGAIVDFVLVDKIRDTKCRRPRAGEGLPRRAPKLTSVVSARVPVQPGASRALTDPAVLRPRRRFAAGARDFSPDRLGQPLPRSGQRVCPRPLTLPGVALSVAEFFRESADRYFRNKMAACW